MSWYFHLNDEKLRLILLTSKRVLLKKRKITPSYLDKTIVVLLYNSTSNTAHICYNFETRDFSILFWNLPAYQRYISCHCILFTQTEILSRGLFWKSYNVVCDMGMCMLIILCSMVVIIRKFAMGVNLHKAYFHLMCL